MDDNEIWVIECCCSAPLLVKTAHSIKIMAEGGPQDLQRYIAPKTAITRAIDLAHPAGADGRKDFLRNNTVSGEVPYAAGSVCRGTS